MNTPAPLFFMGSSFFAGNGGMPKNLDKFEFRQDPITDNGVSCL